MNHNVYLFHATTQALSISAEYFGDIFGFSLLRHLAVSWFASWQASITISTVLLLISLVLVYAYAWVDARRFGESVFGASKAAPHHHAGHASGDPSSGDSALQHMRALSAAYWYTFCFIVLQSAAVFSFMAWAYDAVSVLSNGTMSQIGIDEQLLYFSVGGLIAAVTGGFFADHYGYRGTVMLVCGVLLTLAYAVLAVLAPSESYVTLHAQQNSTSVVVTPLPTMLDAGGALCDCQLSGDDWSDECELFCLALLEERESAAVHVKKRHAHSDHHKSSTVSHGKHGHNHKHHHQHRRKRMHFPAPTSNLGAPTGLRWLLPLALVAQGFAFSFGGAARYDVTPTTLMARCAAGLACPF